MIKIILVALLMLFASPALAERCALIDNGAITEWTQTKDANCPPDPTGKGWDWKPAPIVAKPAYDPATQVMSGPTYSVGASSVTESWSVRAKTAPELAADVAAADAGRLSEQQQTGLLKFTASVTIGSVAAATFTDKTFTVPGLLTTDFIVSVTFTAGLTPATISYMPLRVSAANTLAVRFAKIATGAVTPPAPQSMTVVVLR